MGGRWGRGEGWEELGMREVVEVEKRKEVPPGMAVSPSTLGADSAPMRRKVIEDGEPGLAGSVGGKFPSCHAYIEHLLPGRRSSWSTILRLLILFLLRYLLKLSILTGRQTTTLTTFTSSPAKPSPSTSLNPPQTLVRSSKTGNSTSTHRSIRRAGPERDLCSGGGRSVE